MRQEVESAAKFLVDLMKAGSSGSKNNKNRPLTEAQWMRFQLIVTECLTNYYLNHWHPEYPYKGSGYRCIRMNGKIDPLLGKAAALMGIAATMVHSLFPSELTMWVDPDEVSYRIGENGSICILYVNEERPRSRNISPPTTPPNKRVCTSPEHPSTPMKMLASALQLQQHHLTTPPHVMVSSAVNPQALSFPSFSTSPSNASNMVNRQTSPIHQFQQPTLQQQLQHQHQLALLKESNPSNCKDVLRAGHIMPLERGLFVSS